MGCSFQDRNFLAVVLYDLGDNTRLEGDPRILLAFINKVSRNNALHGYKLYIDGGNDAGLVVCG